MWRPGQLKMPRLAPPLNILSKGITYRSSDCPLAPSSSPPPYFENSTSIIVETERGAIQNTFLTLSWVKGPKPNLGHFGADLLLFRVRVFRLFEFKDNPSLFLLLK